MDPGHSPFPSTTHDSLLHPSASTHHNSRLKHNGGAHLIAPRLQSEIKLLLKKKKITYYPFLSTSTFLFQQGTISIQTSYSLPTEVKSWSSTKSDYKVKIHSKLQKHWVWNVQFCPNSQGILLSRKPGIVKQALWFPAGLQEWLEGRPVCPRIARAGQDPPDCS